MTVEFGVEYELSHIWCDNINSEIELIRENPFKQKLGKLVRDNVAELISMPFQNLSDLSDFNSLTCSLYRQYLYNKPNAYTLYPKSKSTLIKRANSTLSIYSNHDENYDLTFDTSEVTEDNPLCIYPQITLSFNSPLFIRDLLLFARNIKSETFVAKYRAIDPFNEERMNAVKELCNFTDGQLSIVELFLFLIKNLLLTERAHSPFQGVKTMFPVMPRFINDNWLSTIQNPSLPDIIHADVNHFIKENEIQDSPFLRPWSNPLIHIATEDGIQTYRKKGDVGGLLCDLHTKYVTPYNLIESCFNYGSESFSQTLLHFSEEIKAIADKAYTNSLPEIPQLILPLANKNWVCLPPLWERGSLFSYYSDTRNNMSDQSKNAIFEIRGVNTILIDTNTLGSFTQTASAGLNQIIHELDVSIRSFQDTEEYINENSTNTQYMDTYIDWFMHQLQHL